MKQISYELGRAWGLARSPAMQTVRARAGLPEPQLFWGIDWVEPEGRFYRPAAEAGRVAAIFGVWEEHQMIDLVAVSLETRACRRRRGLATLLGHDRCEAARRFGGTLTLFADPLAWLAGERRGAVVLDWESAPYLLRDVERLACPDEALALRLSRAFRDELLAPPPIFVTTRKTKETEDAERDRAAAAWLRAVRRDDRRVA